jgi:hypothetical protein
MFRKLFALRLIKPKRLDVAILRSKEIDFENDSLRFTFDSYLIEYQTIRSEIEERLVLQEKTINYLLMIVAAIISASQIFTEQTEQLFFYMKTNPELLIIFAIASLYFPYAVINNNIFMAVLGAYENNVISPKIDAIARILSCHSSSTDEYLLWEKENFPGWLRGTLRWDDYRARTMYVGFRKILFGIFGFFEMLFVCAPAILFFGSYLRLKNITNSNWSLFEIGLFAIFLIIVIALFAGIIFGFEVYLGITRIDHEVVREPIFD